MNLNLISTQNYVQKKGQYMTKIIVLFFSLFDLIFMIIFASEMQKKINIQNKKARFEYEFIDKYTAGIQLTGTEIKSIRESKARITESFCEFNEQGELFVVNMFIEEYSHGNFFNHKPKSERRLLLNKRELKKLEKEVKNSGLTIVPLRLFMTDKGWAKLDIALAKGKKLHDKRETMKDRDNKRDLARIKKNF